MTSADRIRDVVALVPLLAGIGVFFYARYRLTELSAGRYAAAAGRPFLEQTIYWDRVADAALWTVAIGCVFAVVSALWPRIRLARSLRHDSP